jgi:VWFA-related protein
MTTASSNKGNKAAILLVFLFVAQFFIAQNSPDQPAAVFKAETRQVLVDVVVTDHTGHFIPGLKPDDFTVLEDGKPQKLVAFGAHVQPATPPAPPRPIKLPPNQYTNYQIADPQRPITIVLLDVLNTEVEDQTYTKKQMIAFLKDLPPGQRVALFALGTRLRTIQGFTGDSDTLVKAANLLLRSTSPLMTSEQDTQNSEITASNLAVNAAPGNTGPTSAGQSPIDPAAVAPVTDALQKSLVDEQVYQQMQRMDFTLSALQTLARAVSAYPGRKNLLWLSSEFPIRFSPNFLPVNSASEQGLNGFDASRKMDVLRNQSPPIQKTAAMLTASQIAVYPIDIRGTISVSNHIDISAPDINGGAERIGSTRDRTANRQTTMEWDDHEAMADIARETGGQAFYGSNDLQAALSRSMDDGSNYYTIAYTPQNHDWNGKYRKIELKCAQGGAKLTYRRGYYAVADTNLAANGKVVDDQVALLFANAMHPEAPTSTMVLLKVQVLPPDPAHKTVRIDYAINAQDITFTDDANNSKHVALDLMAVAWDKDGKAAAADSGKIDTSISADAYKSVMRSYVPAHQELEVKPGNYTLRLGVVDRSSRKIGTLDVPLTVTELQTAGK